MIAALLPVIACASCAELPRVKLAAGATIGPAMPGGREVALADQGYDVGWLLLGGRLAATLRPIWILELGVAARRWQIDEGIAPDGAVLRSRGDAAAGLIGLQIPTSDPRLGIAAELELGSIRATQTLRGEAVTGSALAMTGRVEAAFGAGPTAVAVAIEIGAAIFEQLDPGLTPRLSTPLALHVGLVHRL